ncbi:hypothetical protein DFH29DRAFT_1051947 [Suillus ampliporus]|nr:hypothetical protein DFH29DRAFT_1051947 [Suillus ampliporus]
MQLDKRWALKSDLSLPHYYEDVFYPLSKLFEPLTVDLFSFHLFSNDFKIATAQQTGASMRRRPFEFVCPKRQLQTNRSINLPYAQYYRYAVSSKWLIQFAEGHYPETLPDRDDIGYEDIAISRAYELISAWSGIYYLGHKDCFNPKGGSVPPLWFALYEGDYDDELDDDALAAIQVDTVQVFAVCSDKEDEFEERPAQE